MKKVQEKKQIIANLEKFQSDTPSNWRQVAEERRNNKEWLRKSQKIATMMLVEMDKRGLKQGDVAKAMGVTQQYVSRILSGKVNLTLDTIAKIEDTLHIHILAPAPTV